MKTIFRFNDDEYLFEVILVAEYINMEGDKIEKEFPFKNGKELHSYMENIFMENWYGLFEEKELENGIIGCSIKGIMVIGNNNEGRLNLRITDGYAQGTIAIDDELLKDENAQKIKEILEIAKR